MTTQGTPIGGFRLGLPPTEIAHGDALRVRSLATWACIALMPGFAFLRQRSEFVQGFEAAARAGGALDEGASAGAVGVAGASAIGTWMMLPDPADARTQTVLASTDTLYGMALLEFDRHGPVVLGLPEGFPDGRYWSIAGMDAMLNNNVHLGPKWPGSGPGEHLLVGPGWDGEPPPWAAGVIRMSTDSACLYARVLLGYEDGDLERLRAWRERITLTTLAEREGGPPPAIETHDLVHGDLRHLHDPWRFLELGFAHLDRNPPPPEGRWLLDLLRSGGFDRPGDEQRGAAVEDGFRDAQAILDAAISGQERRDGWTVPFAHTAEPGPWVLEQAVTQLRAIGSNDPAEAIYLFADADGEGRPLDPRGGAVYELRFAGGALPPLDEAGFWSVTMYRTSNSLLVDNPAGRFATRLERPGFVRDADGGAAVVLATNHPEGVAEQNWLPAPADEPFQLGLRLYYPGAAIREGRWSPPPVRRRP